MKFCSHCGGEIKVSIPPLDNAPRHICESCGSVFYSNPKIIVGCLPRWENQILLCKRAIEPRKGFWTLPTGYMENGETVEEGALRETSEEAMADVTLIGLHTVYSLTHINQVYLVFLADLQNLDFGPGEESEEVRLFDLEEIPWEHLAFRAISFCLRQYVETGGEPPNRVVFGSYGRG